MTSGRAPNPRGLGSLEFAADRENRALQMGKKQRIEVADRLAAIPADEGRVIPRNRQARGRRLDDPRLDILFLTLPVSWRGTVAQYAGRLHRLYDGRLCRLRRRSARVQFPEPLPAGRRRIREVRCAGGILAKISFRPPLTLLARHVLDNQVSDVAHTVQNRGRASVQPMASR